MASWALLVAMPIPVVTRELVSSLSVSLQCFIHIYLHRCGDAYDTPEDIPQVYL